MNKINFKKYIEKKLKKFYKQEYKNYLNEYYYKDNVFVNKCLFLIEKNYNENYKLLIHDYNYKLEDDFSLLLANKLLKVIKNNDLNSIIFFIKKYEEEIKELESNIMNFYYCDAIMYYNNVIIELNTIKEKMTLLNELNQELNTNNYKRKINKI